VEIPEFMQHVPVMKMLMKINTAPELPSQSDASSSYQSQLPMAAETDFTSLFTPCYLHQIFRRF